ncbi:hypothetical protein BD779DRAFT_1038881 [Infundibulicybe gibba]|nr:hypothetical protein BD779DRAFT_1038881 [Infundibulicybe gibba]
MIETRSTDSFWDGILHDRIDHIGSAPSQQYSDATSIGALNEGKQILEDAKNTILNRYVDEQQAIRSVLKALSEHCKREAHAIAQSIATIDHHRMMCIPPEIMSQIFVLHAQRDSRGRLNAALTSTHVCRRWWQIGRTCPELWSHIDSRHSAALMAWMIKRSGAVPLSLAISEQAILDAPRLALVSRNLHRFGSLSLSVRIEAFNQPAPLLQLAPPLLTLKNHENWALVFPPEFLSGSAPNLRHVKLTTERCIPWQLGLFTHLTTLDVSGSEEISGVDPPSLGALLSALMRMPELETLILRRCVPPPIPSTTMGAHVDLSNLKRLEVEAPLTRCTCLLSQITINPSATLLLNLECSSVSREDVEEFFTVFPSHLYTTSTPVSQALRFMWRDSRHLNFKVDVWTVQQNTEVKTPQNASIKLVFDCKSTRPPTASPLDLVWACFVALASPQLYSFRLGGYIAGWDAEVWRRLARVAPDLRRIATEVQGTELLKALSPPDVPDPVLGDCPFPALTYLELRPPSGYCVPTPDGGDLCCQRSSLAL